jgi:hypothetical protein
MLPCTDSFLTISQAFQPACMRGTTPEGTLSLFRRKDSDLRRAEALFPAVSAAEYTMEWSSLC